MISNYLSLKYDIMKKNFLPFLYIFIFSNLLDAQTSLPNNPTNLPTNLSVLVKPESKDGWVFLKDSLYVHPDTLFTKYKSWFELGPNDSVVCILNEQDSFNGNYRTYILFHKGIEVYPY